MRDDKEKIIHETLIKNYNKYYRIAFGYVHNENDALDIVQEGAYKAIYRADKLREIKYVDTWICRIMINEAIEFLRENDREYVEWDNCEMGEEQTYEDLELRKAIDALPQNERTIIQLRYFEDMSLKQVSEVMNENLSTIKSRLYRALSKLKLAINEN